MFKLVQDRKEERVFKYTRTQLLYWKLILGYMERDANKYTRKQLLYWELIVGNMERYANKYTVEPRNNSLAFKGSPSIKVNILCPK